MADDLTLPGIAQLPVDTVEAPQPPVLPTDVNAPSAAVATAPQTAATGSTPDASYQLPDKEDERPDPFNVLKSSKSTDTTDKDSYVKYNPDAVAGLGDAFNKQIAAQQSLKKANVDMAKAQYETHQKSLDELKAQNDITNSNEAARQSAVQSKFDALSGLTDALNNNSTIDPNRLFGEMNTGAKIMSGIGLALGALGQARSAPGSSNMAMDVLNNVIERDIQAQKDTFNNKAKVVEAQRQGFTQYMGLLGDQRQAELAERNRQLDFAGKQLELVSDKYKGSINGANADIAISEVKKQQAMNSLELSKHIMDNTKVTKDGTMESSEAALKRYGQTFDGQSAGTSRYTGKASTSEEAIKFRASLQDTDRTDTELARMEHIGKKYTWPQIQADPDLLGEVKKATSSLKAQLIKTSLGASRVTQGEIEVVQDGLGDLSELFSRNSVTLAKIAAFRRDQQTEVDKQARTIKLQVSPYKKVYDFTNDQNSALNTAKKLTPK